MATTPRPKPRRTPVQPKFEPAVFTGSVIETTDNAVYIITEVGSLRLPRKPGPTRYAQGDTIELQLRINTRMKLGAINPPAAV